jgi:outer membrane lipopolysaccharide assembly protein LptE/RlpB
MKSMRIAPVSRSLAAAAAAATLMLTGCGLAETTAVTAAQAEVAVEQAKEGKRLEEKVKKDLEAANAAAARQRANAESQGE